MSSILKTNIAKTDDPNLIVGNDTRDDAAVYDIGNGQAIISTTDFFMPIVDDAYTFGRIAATNAISDVYAMGGKPVFAIAILGWPVDKLAPEIAQQVLEGGRAVCKQAGIQLAGGHSIDNPEPVFGLAVTGMVELNKLKRNDTATEGCSLYLTKPLGIGILTTAQKAKVLKEEHKNIAPELMAELNILGDKFAEIEGIKAMTDVTGFGLLGHLTEMCEGSNLSAEINFEDIPVLPVLDEYLEMNCIPGGTNRNWDSYRHTVNLRNKNYKNILCDPQTSGGLLIAVEPHTEEEVEALLKSNGIKTKKFGKFLKQREPLINVI